MWSLLRLCGSYIKLLGAKRSHRSVQGSLLSPDEVVCVFVGCGKNGLLHVAELWKLLAPSSEVHRNTQLGSSGKKKGDFSKRLLRLGGH